MANSSWRIGSFYFKTQEEPYRVDLRRVRRTEIPGKYRYIPWTVLRNTGYQPTNIVLQGMLADFLQGTSGDYGLEQLDIEFQKGDEVIVELENFDAVNNLRRYYGILNDFKYTLDGKKPALYDYLVSIVCPNPFGFRAGAVEYRENTITSTSDPGTAISFANDFPGAPIPVYFRYYNDTGSTVTSLTISDDATSTANTNKITVSGSLANGKSWLIYPHKYNNVKDTYELYAVWEYNGDTVNTSDIMELSADNSLITTGAGSCALSSGSRWPSLRSANDDWRAKASHSGGELLFQWRDIL